MLVLFWRVRLLDTFSDSPDAVVAHLRNSKYLEDVPQMAACFDKTTKLLFKNKDEAQYIRFGSLRDKDLAVGIRSGQLKLSG